MGPVSKITTLDMVSAGLHCSLSMSKQMFPLLLMFGWKTLVRKATCKKNFQGKHQGWSKTMYKEELHMPSLWYTFGGLKG